MLLFKMLGIFDIIFKSMRRQKLSSLNSSIQPRIVRLYNVCVLYVQCVLTDLLLLTTIILPALHRPSVQYVTLRTSLAIVQRIMGYLLGTWFLYAVSDNIIYHFPETSVLLSSAFNLLNIYHRFIQSNYQNSK